MVDKKRMNVLNLSQSNITNCEQNNTLEPTGVAFSSSLTPELVLRLHKAIGLESIKDLLYINHAHTLLPQGEKILLQIRVYALLAS